MPLFYSQNLSEVDSSFHHPGNPLPLGKTHAKSPDTSYRSITSAYTMSILQVPQFQHPEEAKHLRLIYLACPVSRTGLQDAGGYPRHFTFRGKGRRGCGNAVFFLTRVASKVANPNTICSQSSFTISHVPSVSSFIDTSNRCMPGIFQTYRYTPHRFSTDTTHMPFSNLGYVSSCFSHSSQCSRVFPSPTHVSYIEKVTSTPQTSYAFA